MLKLVSHSHFKATLGALAIATGILACGRSTQSTDSQVAQVAAPAGSFLELCRKSTVGGVGADIATTVGRMRRAAESDGDAASGRCEDVAQALSKMSTLDLSSSAITDVSPIARVKNLKILLLAENNIKDLKPLLSMPNLIGVNVSRNRFPLTCPFADKEICTGIH